MASQVKGQVIGGQLKKSSEGTIGTIQGKSGQVRAHAGEVRASQVSRQGQIKGKSVDKSRTKSS
jgi:hypothetical protein